MSVFLYCCSDYPSCLAYAIQMGQATQAIKKYIVRKTKDEECSLKTKVSLSKMCNVKKEHQKMDTEKMETNGLYISL